MTEPNTREEVIVPKPVFLEPEPIRVSELNARVPRMVYRAFTNEPVTGEERVMVLSLIDLMEQPQCRMVVVPKRFEGNLYKVADGSRDIMVAIEGRREYDVVAELMFAMADQKIEVDCCCVVYKARGAVEDVPVDITLIVNRGESGVLFIHYTNSDVVKVYLLE